MKKLILFFLIVPFILSGCHEKNKTNEKQAKELALLRKFSRKLQNIDTSSLSENMFYDLRILQCAANQEIFNFEDLDSYYSNPMTYAGECSSAS